EPAMRSVLSRYIEALGHRCVSVGSPAEALIRLEEGNYALLVTDLRMPEMDGIELMGRARAHDRDLAVVVVTALTDVNHAVLAMRAGADDYILKPFTYSDLALAASKALGKRAAHIRTRRHN